MLEFLLKEVILWMCIRVELGSFLRSFYGMVKLNMGSLRSRLVKL